MELFSSKVAAKKQKQQQSNKQDEETSLPSIIRQGPGSPKELSDDENKGKPNGVVIRALSLLNLAPTINLDSLDSTINLNDKPVILPSLSSGNMLPNFRQQKSLEEENRCLDPCLTFKHSRRRSNSVSKFFSGIFSLRKSDSSRVTAPTIRTPVPIIPPPVVNYGSYTDIGNKNENQDAFLISKLDKDVLIFLVLDGHGKFGRSVALFIQESFVGVLRNNSNFKDGFGNVPLALVETFHELHELLVESSIDTYLSGTTATVAILVGSILTVANVGDSAALMAQNIEGSLSPKLLTIDHNCENELEAKRLTSKGARLEPMKYEGEFVGPLRLWKGTMPYPGQCVTRTIGDEVAHQIGVVSTPEVIQIALSPTDKHLVLASDGVWDGLSHDQVILILSKVKDPQKAAETIVANALIGLDREELDDNVTALSISFG